MQIVVGHANPDFDAYAATVAATKLFPGARGVFLGTHNANVRAFHNLHEDFLDFVDLKGLEFADIERLVMVDTRDPSRIGELARVAADPSVEVIVYDHHPPAEGDVVGADDRSLQVGSTTSILVHEIHRRGIPIAPLEASLFLLGIHEDTGSLTYPGATPYDAEAVVHLMAAGADLDVLNQFLLRTLDPLQRELLEQLASSLEVWEVNGQHIAVGVARTEQYVDSASVLSHHIVEDMGHRVAIAVVEMLERIHVVARSRVHEVDVGRVMTAIGGGGHSQAASAALRETTVARVLALVKDSLSAWVRPPLRASDIASTPVRVVTPDTTMSEAFDLMSQWGHGGMPVVERDAIVGMVTRKDVDKARRHSLAHAPVRGFMAREIVTIAPETRVVAIEQLLATKGIGRLPVVVDGAIVGIVTRKDLLRAKHGEEYLDRKIPRARAGSTQRFLTSVESLLPQEAVETLREAGKIADRHGVRVHAVGGFVRDMLLGRRNLDIDVVVEGDGIAFAQRAAEAMGARVKIHRRFQTAVLVVSKRLHVDVTSARTEYYARPGALPTVERSSLRQDLFRRDFTINAIAACVNGECFGAIADPFGGLRDLERATVRVLHSLSFIEDPTRILRAARFEERFGFVMDGATEELARCALEKGVLDEVSGARIREELLDIIDEDAPSRVLARLHDIGALALLVPTGVNPAHVIDALRSTESAYRVMADAFARSPRRRVTLVAALVAQADRRNADRWLRHMRFGREYGEPALVLAEKAAPLLKLLQDRRRMRDSRLYRLLFAVPDEALVYLWGAGDTLVKERIEYHVKVLSRVLPAVDGTDLIAMGLTPSPAFSAILAQALDARLDGIAIGRERELANLRRLVVRNAAQVDPLGSSR